MSMNCASSLPYLTFAQPQVIMNLQLYMADSVNYLVDFHHKESYKASADPGAGKFDMAVFDPTFSNIIVCTLEIMNIPPCTEISKLVTAHRGGHTLLNFPVPAGRFN
jgi:hypothetical protein